MSQALKEALEKAQVPRIVVLSSIGGERSSGTGNILTAYILEQVVFVRACSFTENWIHPIQAVKFGNRDAILTVMQKLDQKLAHVATNDIGRVVAQFMIENNEQLQHNTIVELKDPEDISAVAMNELTVRNMFEHIGWKWHEDSIIK